MGHNQVVPQTEIDDNEGLTHILQNTATGATPI